MPSLLAARCTSCRRQPLLWQHSFCSAREQVALATRFFSASCASRRRLFISQDAISCEIKSAFPAVFPAKEALICVKLTFAIHFCCLLMNAATSQRSAGAINSH